MAQTVPRQHHHTPEAYLAGFTADGLRSTQLWVTDLADKRQFRARPSKTGKERDFYTVGRVDGGDPQEIEKWLGEHVDAEGARVLRDLDESSNLPTGADHEWLMLFIAGMVVRGRYFRERIDSFSDRIAKTQFWYIARNDAAFRAFIERIPKELRDKEGFSEEALRELILSEEYDIGLEQTDHVRFFLEMLPRLAHVLGQRTWRAMRSIDPHACFVCSDHPVSLVHKSPKSGHMGIGYGMAETLTFFPVSRRLAIVGTFERESQPSNLSPDQVAWVNSHTAQYAVRYLYSPTKEIIWLNGSRTVYGTDQLLDQKFKSRATLTALASASASPP